jgi:hypothetical protein
MRRRARRLRRRARRRRVDVLMTYMPPAGGRATGSATVRGLVERIRPGAVIHGVAKTEEWTIGKTRVISAVPSRVIDLDTVGVSG